MRALLIIALIGIATPAMAQNMDVQSFDDGFVLGQILAQPTPKMEVPLPDTHPLGYPFQNAPDPYGWYSKQKPTTPPLPEARYNPQSPSK